MKLGSIVKIATGVVVIGGIAGREIVKRRLTRKLEVQVTKTVIVGAEPGDIYDRLHTFESFPRFLTHVGRVKARADGTCEWEIAEGPVRLRFRTTLIDDVPNKRIAWRTLSGGDLRQEGSITLRPALGNRGTEMQLELAYAVPSGSRGPARDWMERASSAQIASELCCVKPWLETGESAAPPEIRKPGPAKVRLSIVGRDKTAS